MMFFTLILTLDIMNNKHRDKLDKVGFVRKNLLWGKNEYKG